MRRVRGEFRAAFSRASDSDVEKTAECGKEGGSSIHKPGLGKTGAFSRRT